jgi:hypothetical protein
MSKGIIYYSHGVEEPICSAVRKQLLKSKLPIVSCTLKPIDFGENIVLDLEPSILTMTKQILAALGASKADTVFFCEHDVLYHPTHFDFNLPTREKYYYNVNVWRWWYPKNRAITYDFSRSLSGMCCDRERAIKHYKERVKYIEKCGNRARFGFEPGTRKIKDGGVTDEEFEDWKSELPNIDIRHRGTITPRKCHHTSFVVPPDWSTWKRITLDKIPGWDYEFLKSICPTET